MASWEFSLKSWEVRQRSWYCHACGGHSVACHHLIISPQSYCLLQRQFHTRGLQCSCPLSWKGSYSTWQHSGNGPASLPHSSQGMCYKCGLWQKLSFFLSIAMIQYLFQLLTVSMDFDQALKSLSIFLTAGLYCPYFPFVSIASLKVRKIFWWIPAGKVKSYIPT